jgi:hypothetical protein
LDIVQEKENSKELVWQIIMVDGEWCGCWGGKKGKIHGNEDSANANDFVGMDEATNQILHYRKV